MAIYFEQTNRLIIPRWRRFHYQNFSDEHKLLLTETHSPTELQRTHSLRSKYQEWEINKTYGNAWELVNSAYINQDFEPGREAAIFLNSNVSQLSKRLQNVIKEILEGPIAEKSIQQIEVVPVTSLVASAWREIQKVKRKISFYLRNEFLWLELGRLYSVLGELKKAEQCIGVASHFSNNENRYFLRSVSRFYYHIGKFDEAQAVIRRSSWFKKDPWLLSADISYANKMERHAVNAKQALELLESNNYSNESISELAGVLGTMEFKNDSFKKARRLTRQSLLAPNDNSLAQAEWIGREIDQISIEPWIDKIEYGYEARTFEYLYAKNYQKTLDEALHWVMDQPFSKRACHFVSYFCIGLTENYPLAIEVGELGAKSNPDHFPILNNLAFAYISSGDFVNAEGILEQLSKLVTDARTQCFALATTGYYYYRKKDIILGKEFYEKAIEVATGSNLQDLKKLAEANFLREKCIAGELSYLLAINALEKIKQGIKKVDLEEQLNHIAETITKKFHKVR